ncbi:MAG: hypothetical protein LUI60_04475 [Clostridia bacterium]|nr:hypothetical protein [Clostridia bacterium]
MRNKRKDDLDTETSFADMNVDGMRGYNPNKKKGKDTGPKVSKREQRKMIRAAFAAFAPMFCIIIIVGLLMMLLAYLWLG